MLAVSYTDMGKYWKMREKKKKYLWRVFIEKSLLYRDVSFLKNIYIYIYICMYVYVCYVCMCVGWMYYWNYMYYILSDCSFACMFLHDNYLYICSLCNLITVFSQLLYYMLAVSYTNMGKY